MGFKILRELPSAERALREIRLNGDTLASKKNLDAEIINLISGADDRILLIIGPCSADDGRAVLDYCNRLSRVAEKVKDRALVIPRVFTAKPRTAGTGYMGMLHGSDGSDRFSMSEAVMKIRSLYARIICETGLGIAYELLYPELFPYFEDMVSYVAVGARSVENQQHRLVSSGISAPVGMKNPVDGRISVMFNAIGAAQAEQTLAYSGAEVETTGNPCAHAILRGYAGRDGINSKNCDYGGLVSVAEGYASSELQNPFVVVDTNHSNSDKKYYLQSEIVADVMASRKKDAVLRKLVRGFMIESYIEEGSQDITGGAYGKSVTDGCIGWDETERLLEYIAENA